MTVLSDGDIDRAVREGALRIEPFDPAHLTPNGYDLEIAEVFLPDTGERVGSGALLVPALTRFVVSTRERVALGERLAGQLWLRTTWARRGVLASFGKIDAGFDGTLTLAAVNVSASGLEVTVGETFAQLVLEHLSGDAEVLYAERSGHYQHQRGVTLATDTLEAPCLEKGCSACCKGTEMPLSEEDLERLGKLGHDPRAFSLASTDGLLCLRNVNGRCYFLAADGLCTVYDDRPEGCRLYPLVLSEETGEAVLDHDCPHKEDVAPARGHVDALVALLQRVGSEGRARHGSEGGKL